MSPKTKPVHLDTQNATQGFSISSAFIVIAFILLCISTLWMATNPSLFSDTGVTSQSRAWTYLTLYGFAVSASFGLIYRAVPFVFGRPLWSEKAPVLHLVFHFLGLASVFLDQFQKDATPSMMGQTFLACGVIVFLVNIGTTLHNRGLSDASGYFIAAALFWIAVSVGIGMPLGIQTSIHGLKETQWPVANLELCLLGFIINTVLGLALNFTLLRLDSVPLKTSTAGFAFCFINGGLAWLFAAITYGPAVFVILCALVYVVGALVFIARFLSITQRHRVDVVDWDVKILLTAISILPVAAGLLVWCAWIRMGNSDQPLVRLEITTILTALLGVAVPGLVALAYQSENLLLGNDCNEGDAINAQGCGACRQKVMGNGLDNNDTNIRLSSQILLASFFNYATGVCLFIGGVGIAVDKMISLGGLFTLVGTVGFLVNFLYLRHEKNPSAINAFHLQA